MSFEVNPNLERDLERQLQPLLQACAQYVETEAKARAPYRTGNLRRSISHEVRPGVAIVEATAHYAAYVEWGTSRMRPQPYLRPALQSLKNFLRRG